MTKNNKLYHRLHPHCRRRCSCYNKNLSVLLLWSILAIILRAVSIAAFAPRPFSVVTTKQRQQQQLCLAAVSPLGAAVPQRRCSMTSTSAAVSDIQRRWWGRCFSTSQDNIESTNDDDDESEAVTTDVVLSFPTSTTTSSTPTSVGATSTSTTSTTNNNNSCSNKTTTTPIRFLGQGPDAIVREGAVLLAPSQEFHHFYRQAAIFIYSIGTDPPVTAVRRRRTFSSAAAAAAVHPDDDDDSTNTFYIRGLIIDHPTAFTINDVLVVQGDDTTNNDSGGRRQNNNNNDDDRRFVGTDFGDTNLVHRGGDKGGDGLILLHNVPSIAARAAAAGPTADHRLASNDDDDDDDDDNDRMIGTSGLYQGGWDHVLPACEQGEATNANFKAFFNYCEFTEQELDDLLRSNENGDGWISMEVLDNRLLLSQEWRRGDCWRRLRNAVREYRPTHHGATAAAPPTTTTRTMM